MTGPTPLRKLVTLVWGDWQSNALWQRIVKHSLACLLAVIIAVLPRFRASSTFLTPMVVVFAHPGQRMGLMVEGLVMILLGSLLGLSWSLLGLRLSGLVADANAPAAYSIRAVFLLVCVLLHGFLRSTTPRLFNFVLFLLVVALLTIQLPSAADASLFATIYTPILLGAGVLVVVNLGIFPELSSSYLGTSTIDTLVAATDTLNRATHWFIAPDGRGAVDTRSLATPFAATTTTTTSGHGSQSSRVANWNLRRRVSRFLAHFPNPFLTGGDAPALSTVPISETTLALLTMQKSQLRSQLSRCKNAQDEVNFEVSLSALSPDAMRPISIRYMASLVHNIITLIGACENKFVLVDTKDSRDDGKADWETDLSLPAMPNPETCNPQTASHTMPPQAGRTSGQKLGATDAPPPEALEAGSCEVLEMVLKRISLPVQHLQASMRRAVDLLASCLAYCFDVPHLPSGAPAPKGILLAEVDLRIDEFSASITTFDTTCAEELKRAIMDESENVADFMPRMETFLISSFLMALRGSAAHILDMLRHARFLVEKRQRHHDASRIWVPRYGNFRKWLSTGGETDAMILPEGAKKAARQGLGDASDAQQETMPEDETDDAQANAVDEESPGGVTAPRQLPANRTLHTSKVEGSSAKDRAFSIRAAAADTIEWVQHSDDVEYALKLAIAVYMVTWPALVSSWNGWYAEVKGVWAPLQLILVFEVAIGTSLFVFFVRLFGVVFGCLVGYLAVEIGRANRVTAVVVLFLGIVPSVYVQVATKYVKAGMISIVSLAVVALAAVNDGASTASDIFWKRLVAFLVGGLVSMTVETAITPVRARDRLVESLSASVGQIQRMQAAVAVGIDDPHRPRFRSRELLERFRRCRDKAQRSLAAAETFLPFCLTEPRLRGSFRPLAAIYKEIIYVLQQIIDRMDNVIQLRRAWGSSILEHLNPQVHAFRRDVAASSTLILFSIHEALTTWLPLPQFSPSPRLAQLRLILRVRELLTTDDAPRGGGGGNEAGSERGSSNHVDEVTASLMTQRNFLSWNASTAGQMEIIEYLEELLDLVKRLVGVNAFRSGMLERPRYRRQVRKLEVASEALERTVSRQAGRPSVGHERDDRDDDSGVSEEEEEERRAQLRRAASVPEHNGAWRQGVQEDCGGGKDGIDGGQDIPPSLRRVGTRLRRDGTLVRRRRFTVGHYSPS